MIIGKYSFGIGDRFAHEGVNQLKALIQAEQQFGVHFVPVWNKSNREHQIVGTEPGETRKEADAAVAALGYKDQYFVDADHINLKNVDRFIDSSDFFTIDVADYIGKEGSMEERFFPAIKEAGKIYRYIAEKKGADNFVTEVSMDEVDVAQTPEELLIQLLGRNYPAGEFPVSVWRQLISLRLVALVVFGDEVTVSVDPASNLPIQTMTERLLSVVGNEILWVGSVPNEIRNRSVRLDACTLKRIYEGGVK